MNLEHVKHKFASKRVVAFILSGAALLLVIIATTIILSKPTRSVAAFCITYNQENAVLAKSYGDTYSVQPFTHSSNNPHDFVVALSKLDSVAPQQIEPDVNTLKQIFVTINKNLSQAASASISGLGAESDVSNWTSQHCHM